MELSQEQLERLVYEAAGIGAGAVMLAAPRVVMPSEQIQEACDKLLREIREEVLGG